MPYSRRSTGDEFPQAGGSSLTVSSQRPPPHSNPIPCDVRALVHPDLRVVDALARLHLLVKRCGRRVELRHACDELRDLIRFAGLGDVLVLRIEPGRQAEQGEQPVGVEEEGDPSEPVA